MPVNWFAYCYADWVLQWGKDEADRIAAEWRSALRPPDSASLR